MFPVDRHLYCFQYFTITINARVDNLVHVCFIFLEMYLQDRFLEVGLFDQKTKDFYEILENCQTLVFTTFLPGNKCSSHKTVCHVSQVVT